MSVEGWLDNLLPGEILLHDSWAEDKENARPVCQKQQQHIISTKGNRKRKREAENDTDDDPTPKPQRTTQMPTSSGPRFAPPSETASSSSSKQSYQSGDDDLQSHKSGQASPIKQIMKLGDQAEPTKFRNFYARSAEMPSDVSELLHKMQDVADGIGILGSSVCCILSFIQYLLLIALLQRPQTWTRFSIQVNRTMFLLASIQDSVIYTIPMIEQNPQPQAEIWPNCPKFFDFVMKLQNAMKH